MTTQLELKKASTFTARERALFTKWVWDHKEFCNTLTARQLAGEAARDLGFPVSVSQAEAMRVACFPAMRQVRVNPNSGRIAELEAQLAALSEKIQQLK